MFAVTDLIEANAAIAQSLCQIDIARVAYATNGTMQLELDRAAADLTAKKSEIYTLYMTNHAN